MFLFIKLFSFNIAFGISLIQDRVQSPHLLIVDKQTNQLHVAKYTLGEYQILATYHTTLGQMKGDKEKKNDLKTPEGIYLFNGILKAPNIVKKLGILAFSMNFPNPFDKLLGRTGSGIMLHATYEMERLKKNNDTEGCVIVSNQEVLKIAPYIVVGLTPILIFENFQNVKNEYIKPLKNKMLVDTFYSWIKSWEKKDIESYIDHYHSNFSAQHKNKLQWKNYKNGLNKRYQSIQVSPETVLVYTHPKYAMITFTQNYHSFLSNGKKGHQSKGTKILYLEKETNKIISENFTENYWPEEPKAQQQLIAESKEDL